MKKGEFSILIVAGFLQHAWIAIPGLLAAPFGAVAQIAAPPSHTIPAEKPGQAIRVPFGSQPRQAEPWPGEIWLNDPDPGVRSKAAFSLGESGQLSTIPTLNKMLDDPAVEVRINAARALGLIGSPEVEPALIRAIKAKPPLAVRYELVKALGSFRTDTSASQLAWELDHSNNQVRVAALESIGKRGDNNLVPAVVKYTKHSEPIVASRAIWALGELGDPKATPVLVEILKQGKSPDLRRESAQALARIGDARSAPSLTASALSKQEHSSVRVAAIRALSRFELGTKMWSDLLPLAKDREPYVRAAAAFTIVKAPSKDVDDTILGLVSDENPGVRRAAVTAMGLQASRYARQLAEIGADKSLAIELRIPALTALSDAPQQELASEAVLSKLAKLLDTTDGVAIQIAGIRLIDAAGGPDSKRLLREFGDKKNLEPDVKEALATGLK